MRASRLMSIVLLLQSRGRLTARELARELEVSVRTVYRDAEALSASGVPIYGEGGKDGGYRLVDGYRTRLTGLTSCEAESLFMVPELGPAAELGFGSAALTARLKLAAALPGALGEHAARIGSRFLLDTWSWQPEAEGSARLPLLTEAVKEQHTLRIGDEVVSPQGIVLEAGRWYLVAHDGTAVRTFEVSGLAEATRAEVPFRHVEGFRLRRYWEGRPRPSASR
ncbi:helix-turn-helix transcriptional regulator [Streptacidiphilus jiangxiensis]|uniref:WYL domain-containing protein n=1 Tax=Streptacidiphilus jiangxiensis TaxID=235985 RepID=A0A1H7YLM0_STRJI|nr:HTH domain-containing protein [Streptacidiphilus jiangxiensis]SEM46853.1 WYL domain-containing protein [Streptacidiphilus jiangxiensis]